MAELPASFELSEVLRETFLANFTDPRGNEALRRIAHPFDQFTIAWHYFLDAGDLPLKQRTALLP